MSKNTLKLSDCIGKELFIQFVSKKKVVLSFSYTLKSHHPKQLFRT